MSFARILIVGLGTMTSAMLEGWLASKMPAERFTVYNPRPKAVPGGTAFTDTLPAEAFDAVVLGFKPHMLAEVAPAMQAVAGHETVILSVLAGVELASLRAAFPRASAVVRFMPNLAVALGKSPNGLIGEGLDVNARAQVTDLAERLGSAEWIEDEAQFDLVTALAGSGPGFVYRFIDALAGAAHALGLAEEQSRRLSIRMVEGAAALAAESGAIPADLADRVASPGGMTREGLDVLDADGALLDLMTRTLRATRDRGIEMAEKARRKG